VNLFSNRRSVLGGGFAAAILVAATLTGCGSGQQSQTATQEPAVNGTSGGTGAIALRDVRIRADITGAALPAGKTVDLMFLASNQSPSESDRLVSITSDVGSVTISPDTPQIPAQHALVVGKPEGAETEALAALSDAVKANAAVKLSKPITNGLTYNFTFKFERSGQSTIAVPVTAGDIATRVEQAPSPPASGEGH
jgi:copper(I)-binding protein